MTWAALLNGRQGGTSLETDGWSESPSIGQPVRFFGGERRMIVAVTPGENGSATITLDHPIGELPDNAAIWFN